MEDTISQLKAQLASLRQEVDGFLDQLSDKKSAYELRNQIQKMGYNGFGNRNGLYQSIINLPEYEYKWRESFFVKHRLIAEKYASFDLSSKSITKAKMIHYQRPLCDKHEYTYLRVVVYCEAVIPSINGPILKLTDPYGSILTEPIETTNFEEACTWIDRILITKIGFSHLNDKHPIEGFKRLKFSLYKDLRN